MLDALLLGVTARLQQYNQLVLAISREIEPLHIRKREQTLDTFCGQVAYNVAVFKPTDSYCTKVRNIFQSRKHISPAVAVHISCRYGTVNCMILSCSWLFNAVPPFCHRLSRLRTRDWKRDHVSV